MEYPEIMLLRNIIAIFLLIKFNPRSFRMILSVSQRPLMLHQGAKRSRTFLKCVCA